MSEIKSNAIALLEHQLVTGEFRGMLQNELEDKLRGKGYAVQRNYTVDMGNGRKWRVDYMITASNGDQCAIEVDRCSPRERSVLKLCMLRDQGIPGFVLLRDGKKPMRYSVDGVDVIRATPFR
ncbi:hypothetical protein FEN12_17275 [Salmonella enterica]|uniref:DUF1064 domain-containing protein n=1 Tax=Salmonella enterica subsp. enterica serovar Cotham TaxID=2572724 RepID=A0A5H7NTH1_SALET|nr:hypothetical protein [Salmonella enterica]EAB6208823.1 hypothetical protein [Salmonella enterica subsp. enterica serovar Agbeni]EBQ4756787.1 hypothetical protein [Salmonella enterica subsp. diarizonae]EBS2731478.1 hypothetical protein [Salmonella enterica subsp. enterica serovar Cotham]EBW6386715.1 hypothetical protein [Salmonella enterica subsp. enterica serovar Stanley]EBX2705838.1 hypothetical protein [Salmonella enterica subsp. enterica serovar Bredeney]ECT8366526.1 hypothetical protei